MFRDPYDPWGRPRVRPVRPQSIPVGLAARPAPTPAPVRLAPQEEPAPAAAAAEPEKPSKDDALRQALEDLAATKRRLEREQDRVLEETRAAVVERMLPVLDNLDRSIASAAAPEARADGGGLLDGIRLVRDQFEDALARSGLERIQSRGARFDPAVHDAVGVVEVDDPELDGVVTDEWQRGYRLGDRIVRAPKVRVGKLVR